MADKQLVQNAADDMDDFNNFLESIINRPSAHNAHEKVNHPNANCVNYAAVNYPEVNNNDAQANYAEYMNLMQSHAFSPNEQELSNDLETISADDEEADDDADAADYAEAGPSNGIVFPDNYRFLPLSNVEKIMRKHVKDGTKISKEIKMCVQECASEFVSFVTSEANDRRMGDKRREITGEDILVAMATLGFDSYVDPLRNCLDRCKDLLKIRPKKTQRGAKNESD